MILLKSIYGKQNTYYIYSIYGDLDSPVQFGKCSVILNEFYKLNQYFILFAKYGKK